MRVRLMVEVHLGGSAETSCSTLTERVTADESQRKTLPTALEAVHLRGLGGSLPSALMGCSSPLCHVMDLHHLASCLRSEPNDHVTVGQGNFGQVNNYSNYRIFKKSL